MANEPNIEHLMLEQFRVIRGDIQKLAEEIRALRIETVATRQHVRGLELQQDGHHDDISSLRARVDQIERRLELTERQE